MGELVAFPTETVYGLGANAFDPVAVRRIFEVKGRPRDNPLIVHLHSVAQIHNLVESLPLLFWVLAARFMPGPLTVVLRKSSGLPKSVTSGLNTIAVRIPDHPVARALLMEVNVPLVAPSANLSGKPSPTRAEHVLEDFDGRIAAVLDSGRSRIGLESTVLDLTKTTPVLLRPGAVGQEEIEEAIGIAINVRKHRANRPSSPGMKYKHYAPEAEVVLFEGTPARIARAMKSMARSLKGQRRVGVLGQSKLARNFQGAEFISLGDSNPAVAAHRLFDAFRSMDRKGVEVILCEGFAEGKMGTALMNRLRKAATRRIRV